MTTPERFLAVAGVAVVASAVLLMVYVRTSNPADAGAPGCAEQRAKFGQALDQVRFSTSAAHSVAVALQDTTKTRNQYLGMITALRRQLPSVHLSGQNLAAATDDLAQASWILNNQIEPLRQVAMLLAEDQRQLSSATPFIREASSDIREEDCTALALTLARSGWPKDRLLPSLADAARITSDVSDKLDVALGLIMHAQSQTHSIASN